MGTAIEQITDEILKENKWFELDEKAIIAFMKAAIKEKIMAYFVKGKNPDYKDLFCVLIVTPTVLFEFKFNNEIYDYDIVELDTICHIEVNKKITRNETELKVKFSHFQSLGVTTAMEASKDEKIKKLELFVDAVKKLRYRTDNGGD